MFYDPSEFNTVWIDKAKTELKFCILPKRCKLSGRVMWFERAYRSRRYFREGDMDIRREDRWFDPDAFMILRLKT